MSCPPLITRQAEAQKSGTVGVSLAREHAVRPCPLSGKGGRKMLDVWVDGRVLPVRLGLAL